MLITHRRDYCLRTGVITTLSLAFAKLLLLNFHLILRDISPNDSQMAYFSLIESAKLEEIIMLVPVFLP